MTTKLSILVAAALLGAAGTAAADVMTETCDCGVVYPQVNSVLGYRCSWVHTRCNWTTIPTGPLVPADYGIEISTPVSVLAQGDYDRCDIPKDGTISTVGFQVSAEEPGKAEWKIDASFGLSLDNEAVQKLMALIPWSFKWIPPGLFEINGHYESATNAPVKYNQTISVQVPACAKRGYTALAYFTTGIKNYVRARGTWGVERYCVKYAEPGSGSAFSEWYGANQCPVRDYLKSDSTASFIKISGKEKDYGCPAGSPCLTTGTGGGSGSGSGN
jgi:hypothetical protein